MTEAQGLPERLAIAGDCLEALAAGGPESVASLCRVAVDTSGSAKTQLGRYICQKGALTHVSMGWARLPMDVSVALLGDVVCSEVLGPYFRGAMGSQQEAQAEARAMAERVLGEVAANAVDPTTRSLSRVVDTLVRGARSDDFAVAIALEFFHSVSAGLSGPCEQAMADFEKRATRAIQWSGQRGEAACTALADLREAFHPSTGEAPERTSPATPFWQAPLAGSAPWPGEALAEEAVRMLEARVEPDATVGAGGRREGRWPRGAGDVNGVGQGLLRDLEADSKAPPAARILASVVRVASQECPSEPLVRELELCFFRALSSGLSGRSEQVLGAFGQRVMSMVKDEGVQRRLGEEFLSAIEIYFGASPAGRMASATLGQHAGPASDDAAARGSIFQALDAIARGQYGETGSEVGRRLAVEGLQALEGQGESRERLGTARDYLEAIAAAGGESEVTLSRVALAASRRTPRESSRELCLWHALNLVASGLSGPVDASLARLGTAVLADLGPEALEGRADSCREDARAVGDHLLESIEEHARSPVTRMLACVVGAVAKRSRSNGYACGIERAFFEAAAAGITGPPDQVMADFGREAMRHTSHAPFERVVGEEFLEAIWLLRPDTRSGRLALSALRRATDAGADDRSACEAQQDALRQISFHSLEDQWRAYCAESDRRQGSKRGVDAA